MSRFGIRASFVLAGLFMTGVVHAAPQDGASCTYSVTHNGPTWNGQMMRIPYDVLAMAWARDGAYGGTGRSAASGFSLGGAAVAVASVSYWFKVTHHPTDTCLPVQFASDAYLSASVSSSIGGNVNDYALATGFQAIGGIALPPTSVAVAATNAGSPVQNSTIALSFGLINFTFTIPGVSVTSDTVDRDEKTTSTSGSRVIEEELITTNCWVKIKVVTSGPFGGRATAQVDRSQVQASTISICGVHNVQGSFSHDASE